jgi:hypothetical protein
MFGYFAIDASIQSAHFYVSLVRLFDVNGMFIAGRMVCQSELKRQVWRI